MTDDERAVVDRFLALVKWMRCRLDRPPTLAELNSAAALCADVRVIVEGGADVEELMLDRLAYTTESVLLWPGMESIFREWLRATADYVCVRVSALRTCNGLCVKRGWSIVQER